MWHRLRGWGRAMLSCAALLGAVSGVVEAAVIKNIVLVHGAFADGSGWSEVVQRLQGRGYHVAVVQNPLTSLEDDVRATERVLDRQSGNVLLVGHSWAGAVISQAGNSRNVRGLVYLSALAPASGESVNGLLDRLNAPMRGLTPDANGWVWLDDPQQFHTVMAGDIPLAKARELAAVQQPINVAAFQGTVSHAAWENKPSWYLITENDHALATPVQTQIAQHMQARVSRLYSSHLSMISHPDAVADFIDAAAQSFK